MAVSVLGPWFLFPPTGTIQRQTNPIFAAGLAASGWVGYATQAAAQAAASAGLLHTVRGAVDSTASAAVSTGKFLSTLSQRTTWIRIAEGVVGLLLIVVAVGKLAEGTQAGKAIAKTAPFLF